MVPLSKRNGKQRKSHPKTFYEKGCRKNQIKQEKYRKTLTIKKLGCHLEQRYLQMKACVAITSYFGQDVKNYFWKKRLLRSGL